MRASLLFYRALAYVVGVGLVVLVLLIRPQGLFGTRTFQRV